MTPCLYMHVFYFENENPTKYNDTTLPQLLSIDFFFPAVSQVSGNTEQWKQNDFNKPKGRSPQLLSDNPRR